MIKKFTSKICGIYQGFLWIISNIGGYSIFLGIIGFVTFKRAAESKWCFPTSQALTISNDFLYIQYSNSQRTCPFSKYSAGQNK
jgi:hypothetical protein